MKGVLWVFYTKIMPITVSHSKGEIIASVTFNVLYPIISMSTFQPKEIKNQEHIRINIIIFIHIHFENNHCAEWTIHFLNVSCPGKQFGILDNYSQHWLFCACNSPPPIFSVKNCSHEAKRKPTKNEEKAMYKSARIFVQTSISILDKSIEPIMVPNHWWSPLRSWLSWDAGKTVMLRLKMIQIPLCNDVCPITSNHWCPVPLVHLFGYTPRNKITKAQPILTRRQELGGMIRV